MSGLLVLAPLRIEAAALRGVAPRVVTTGLRARRLAPVGAETRAIAVAGLCGGVAPRLRAGDVVYASELRRGRESIPLSIDPRLVAALRARGLQVETGAIAHAERVLTPAERAALHADGVLAVDMESAALATAAEGRPFAVVRVVADAAGRRLLDPRLLVEGPRALLALRRAGAALSEWA